MRAWITRPETQVVRDNTGHANLCRVPAQHLPDDLLAQPFARNGARAVHRAEYVVVVVSGALTFGMGDKLTKGVSANKTLAAGGFALMPANMNHFAYTTAKETTIVLFGQGPVEFKYVNPGDDPRTSDKGTK
jgi:uncharacterized RmlC-like cupin family protein